MKVLVCGSRGWTNATAIGTRLADLPRDAVILHGMACGADSIAGLIAAINGLTVLTFKADWKKHGRRAGIVRNLVMLDEQPDLVLAFWDGSSRGAAHTISEARRRGIPVEIITPGRVPEAATSPEGKV